MTNKKQPQKKAKIKKVRIDDLTPKKNPKGAATARRIMHPAWCK